MENVTVIVPVYNVAEYLEECLNSILNQTYKNWKCILINDGSKDNSGEICKKFAHMDNRFVAYDRTNQGVSASRNFGLSMVDTEYVMFVDSDDWVDENYLEYMLNKTNDGADIIMCHSIFEYPSKSINVNKVLPGEIEFNNDNRLDLVLSSINQGYANKILNKKLGFLNTVWGKLYRTSVIKSNGIFFNENVVINEDQLFNMLVFGNISKMKIYDKILYHYRIRNSSTVRKFNENYANNYSIFLYKLKKLIDETYNGNENVLNSFYSMILTCIFNILKNHFFNSEYRNKRVVEDVKKFFEDPIYVNALNNINLEQIKNKEVFFVVYMLKLKMYIGIGLYFRLRDMLKKIVLGLRGHKDE